MHKDILQQWWFYSDKEKVTLTDLSSFVSLELYWLPFIVKESNRGSL